MTELKKIRWRHYIVTWRQRAGTLPRQWPSTMVSSAMTGRNTAAKENNWPGTPGMA
ncbi:MAG: hypothetical protein PHQ27_00810 [Victivallales bacterium]|nr:hypothetical protein [Victivallales bacterium]